MMWSYGIQMILIQENLQKLIELSLSIYINIEESLGSSNILAVHAISNLTRKDSISTNISPIEDITIVSFVQNYIRI